MFLDGLEDAYDKGRLMGTFAEDCAEAFQFTRAAQDDYALAPCPGRCRASKDGAFDAEVAAVSVSPAPAQGRECRTAGPRSAPTNNPARPGPKRSRISNPPSARAAR
jgi:acetyl-CoA C-acetyltransferase